MITVVPVDDRGQPSGDPRDLPDQEAHDVIMAGRATLHRRQVEPPWILLEEAKRALPAMDRVGPPATLEALKRVESDLLPSGVRQTTLNGAHIPWVRYLGDVAFRKALMGPSGLVPNLSSQIGSALAYRLDRKKLVTLDHAPSSEEIATLGILEVPSQHDAEWAGEWHCYAIGPEWLAFRKECLALSNALQDAFESAVREGRILIIEELFPGGRLLHPDRWNGEAFDGTDHCNDWFLLTGGLPESWFGSQASKQSRLGRPKGRGGYAQTDAPFVELILERLDEGEECTVHGAVVDVVDQHSDAINGASYEAKISRLMKRVRDIRS